MRTQTSLAFIFFLLGASCITSTLSVSPTTTEAIHPQYTSTPDANLMTISVEINHGYSQEKISEILYAKWLEHFMGENISIDMRLDEYIIHDINIPFEQRCAKELSGQFVSEANVTVKATLPFASTTSYEHSNWFASRGNIIDAYHLQRLFRGVIYQSGNIYTLLIVERVPMCD